MPKRRNFLKGLAASAVALSVGTVEASKAAPIVEAPIEESGYAQMQELAKLRGDDAFWTKELAEAKGEILREYFAATFERPEYQALIRRQVMAQLGVVDSQPPSFFDTPLKGPRVYWQRGFDLNDA